MGHKPAPWNTVSGERRYEVERKHGRRKTVLLLHRWIRAITLAIPLAISPALSQQPNEHIVFSLAGDLGCGGPGGELMLKQQPWSYGAEFFACQGAHRFSLRFGYQPIPLLPLEAEGYVGLLGELPSIGLLLSGRVPIWGGYPSLGPLNLALRLGFGFTHSPLIGLLPGLRLALALEYWQTIPALSSGTLGKLLVKLPLKAPS